MVRDSAHLVGDRPIQLLGHEGRLPLDRGAIGLGGEDVGRYLYDHAPGMQVAEEVAREVAAGG